MFYLGMDVAKAKLDCCLLLDEASAKRKTKVVNNTRSGIADLLAWVAKQQVSSQQLHVVMEATGVYHEQAALALAEPVSRFPSSIRHRSRISGADWRCAPRPMV